MDNRTNAIVNVLMRLDREANAEGVDAITFARKARAIQNILEVVENDQAHCTPMSLRSW